MRTAAAGRLKGLLLVLFLPVASCDEPEEHVIAPGAIGTSAVYFAGYVYDGVTGRRLREYRIDLKYLDRNLRGTVDGDGRYLVGPLAPNNDFSIVVSSPGYRAFESHNALFLPDPSESLLYDAFLYPDGLRAPGGTMHIRLADSEEAPAGRIRLRPTSGSSLYDDPGETPASVARQVWQNDADLQLQTVFKAFSDGEAEIEPGELIYGVTYRVTVFDVADHQDATGLFTAGVDAFGSFVLQDLDATRLQVVFDTTELRVPSVDGNQDVAFDPFYEFVDCDVARLESPDEDGDGERNQLAAETVVEVTVEGRRLRLAWKQEDCLDDVDLQDRIIGITYGGLSGIHIMPRGGGAGDTTSLGAVYGETVTVQMSPYP